MAEKDTPTFRDLGVVRSVIVIVVFAALMVLVFGGCTVGFFWYMRACWRVAGVLLG